MSSNTALSNQIQFSLTLNTDAIQKNSEKLLTSFMRITGYIERFSGGNKDLAQLINTIQATISALSALRLAIRATQMAAGPVGWLYAGTSIIGAGLAGMAIFESTSGV